MKTIEVYVCDQCEKMIMPVTPDKKGDYPNPPNGFVVEGNIYAADPFEGGLVGNNFPQGCEEIRRSEIRKMCLCRECFLEILHLVPKKKEVDPDECHPALYGIESPFEFKPNTTYSHGRRPSRCLHDNCSACGGTGVRKDGLGACVHMISCPCPKCSPRTL